MNDLSSTLDKSKGIRTGIYEMLHRQGGAPLMSGSSRARVVEGVQWGGKNFLEHRRAYRCKMHAQILEKALGISQKRRRLLEEMRKAVRAGDKDTVFQLARRLTGLTDEQECHRTRKSVN